MSPALRIRPFLIADHAEACALWTATEGLGLTESDTVEEIARFLERNPGLSAVAVAGERLVGTILCGHNGRAGHLTHLAVAPAYRRQGIGQALVHHALEQLAGCRIPRCNIFVYNDNHAGNRFWLDDGWTDPSTWRVLQKRLPLP